MHPRIQDVELIQAFIGHEVSCARTQSLVVENHGGSGALGANFVFYQKIQCGECYGSRSVFVPRLDLTFYKTEFYDPKTDCRILFDEDLRGQKIDRYLSSPMHW